MQNLTNAELILITGLTPHARLHAYCLLAAHPRLVATSGRRTPERNRAVGGVPNSWHLQGRAIDVDGPEDLLQAALKTARAQRVSHGCTGPEEALIHDAGSGRHLHVAW